jgi:hypothetical protein
VCVCDTRARARTHARTHSHQITHDELELSDAKAAFGVAEVAVARDAVEVRLRHVQLGPERLTNRT